jgi:hypothetical protein
MRPVCRSLFLFGVNFTFFDPTHVFLFCFVLFCFVSNYSVWGIILDSRHTKSSKTMRSLVGARLIESKLRVTKSNAHGAQSGQARFKWVKSLGIGGNE